jgi:hypothetical protein
LFSEPTLQQEQVEKGLFTELSSDKATLEEWSDRFGIAGASKEALSEDTLKESVVLKEMARNFKTPMKVSEEPTDEEIQEMVSLVETSDFYKKS